MDTQLGTACILPFELIEIIMGFSTGVKFTWDPDDVANKVVFYKGRYQRKAAWPRRAVPLLLTLGLVCRTWLEMSRKQFFRNRAVLFDLSEDSELKQVLLFYEILSDRDKLPNLPHILSFIETSTIITHSGGEYRPGLHQALLAELLDEMGSRKTDFHPQALELVSGTTFPSYLIQKLTSTFPKITRLMLRTNNNLCHEPADLLQIVTLLPELQDVEVKCHKLSGEIDLSGYCLQDSLHTIRLDLQGIRDWETISLLTEWIQSHTPVHKIRRLVFWSVSVRHQDFIQSFLAICPNLECLWIIAGTRDFSDYSENAFFFDLKNLTRLRLLGFQMIPIAHHSDVSSAEKPMINFIARTLQTANLKSSGTSVLLSLRDFELPLCDWSPIDQVMSETPRDVKLEIRPLIPSLDKERRREREQDVTTRVGAKFPKSQEQSKVIVRFEVWSRHTRGGMSFYEDY